MSLKIICDLIQVSPDSPTGALWAVNYKRHKEGQIFGYLTADKKYWRQKINKKQYAVHNIIWNKVYGSIPDNKTVDHIDNNGLNNVLDNLRLADTLNQLHNRRSWGQSKYKGVSKVNKHDNYCAYILYPRYGRVHLGYYKIEEHAAIAHDIAAKILFAENNYYKINFKDAYWLHENTHVSEKVLEKIHTFLQKT